MGKKMVLLPAPRRVEWLKGCLVFQPGKLMVIHHTNPQSLFSAAKRLQKALNDYAGVMVEVAAGSSVPAELTTVTLQVLPEKIRYAQGYELAINEDGVRIQGHDEAGVFYGVCTLIQMLQQTRNALPCVRVEDWPDFPARGVMLDISRDKVPTLETLFNLVDLLAGWKINQLQLYTEHTFAYRSHPVVWEKASPLTGEEILALDAFCKERCVELVPNQNSFGHMERWLKFGRYAPMAEIIGSFVAPWGLMMGPFSLCPVDPASLDFLNGLYDELLPHFASRIVNIGCDETWDLGAGGSKEACEKFGTGRVYVDFLLKIMQSMRRRGFRTQFWGDIILQHPELIRDLPTDVIALEWGYEASHPFDAHGQKFAEAGIPFYVCPGTSAWNTIAGRTQNALANLRSAAENGLKHGACGYLITDWGDNGHWQALPVSYTGFVAGAADSWALQANREVDISSALSCFAFADANQCVGKAAYDLGNVYLATGIELDNITSLFGIMQGSLEEIKARAGGLDEGRIAQTEAAIAQAEEVLSGEAMSCTDAVLVRKEFHQTAHLLRHACQRARLALAGDESQRSDLRQQLAADLKQIIDDYRANWLARNRPGGLVDSLARLEKLAADY
jgi:hexosaminidase